MASSPNFLNQLRLRGIFGNQPQAQFGGQVNNRPLFETPQVEPNPPMNAPDTGLMALRKRPTPDQDVYRALLNNAPTRKDYELSGIGKALAGAAGVIEGGITKSPSRGVAVGQGLMERPYNRALEDYSNKGGRLRELAELEYRGAGDEQKLEVAIAKNELEQQKAVTDALKAISDASYNEARIRNVNDQIKKRGLTVQQNSMDGQLYVIDPTSGTRTSLGKFAESVGEKRTNDFGFFKKEEGVRQTGRRELQQSSQAHDAVMAGIKFKNDKELAKIKGEMDKSNVSATQDNAAFEGAYKEILTEYPEMKAVLFTTDDKGELILKVDPKTGSVVNPDAYQMFINNVRERKNMKLGGNPSGMPAGFYDANKDKTTTPNATNPGATSGRATIPPDKQASYRAAAIQSIKSTYPDDPSLLTNEDAITEAMTQLAETGFDPDAKPPVVAEAPPGAYPTVNAPQNVPMPFQGLMNRLTPDYGLRSPGGILSQPTPMIPQEQFGPMGVLPEAYPPMYPQPQGISRTQRELDYRGVTGNRFR
jgi:hypothetical protein